MTGIRMAVVGATGRIGRRLAHRLLHDGHHVAMVGRDAGKLRQLAPGGAEPRIADVEDEAALRAALAGTEVVLCCLHPRFFPRMLPCMPASLSRLVLLGSTRRYSRIPDAAAEQVRRAEAAFVASGIPGVMLHPTMIYGGDGENNLQRIAAIARRFRVIPLPGGGRSLIQPIHADDVVAALAAAATARAAPGAPIVLAGPEPMTFAELVRATAAAAGQQVMILPVPLSVTLALSGVTRLLPERLRVLPNEVRRLLEDKAFDTTPMRTRLAVEPMSFEAGLRLTFKPD